jgi:hypothetical protein
MKTVVIAVLLLVVGCQKSPEPSYMITGHKIIPAAESKLGIQVDEYAVTYGPDILRVTYQASQTSSAKPGDPIGSGLHEHSSYSNPDLSQVSQVGISIRQCEMSKDVMHDGSPIIAVQSTPEPCMVQIGDTLRYEPEPNAGKFTYVNFDIVSEHVR